MPECPCSNQSILLSLFRILTIYSCIDTAQDPSPNCSRLRRGEDPESTEAAVNLVLMHGTGYSRMMLVLMLGTLARTRLTRVLATRTPRALYLSKVRAGVVSPREASACCAGSMVG